MTDACQTVTLFSRQLPRGWAWEIQHGKRFQQSFLSIYNPTDPTGFWFLHVSNVGMFLGLLPVLDLKLSNQGGEGNVHSKGEIVMKRLGGPNCSTASIKYLCCHFQYSEENFFASNAVLQYCLQSQLAMESVGLCPLSWFAREGIRVVTVLDL